MGKWYNVGKIVNTHGIKGEVRVISKTDFAEERYELGNKLYIFTGEDNQPIEVVVKSHRLHKNFDLLTFEGYHNVNEVEKYKGSLLKVPEDQLSELDEGEFYFHEIIGCHVYTDEAKELGTVKEILTPGANDVWVVKGHNNQEILIPYIDDIVLDINIHDKKIVIKPLEGLL
ncbi:ribosome maturation factor RimM [Cytobacillus sp. IB215316]|uniref:ribosome maturation factor RimM n=1 Tax=Cytobacillus sp. IB215316 TaxID=3097354 RepID=UPI002A0E359F|nr:ribosome maturation factor RimM [Cytobacillus sp. IB215316]MDX8362276.1 ribosome maturation factor RimM [Cytobacillus sp. IB215316]